MSYINNLQKVLQSHFKYNKARTNFISSFVLSLVKLRTVKLSDISLNLNYKSKPESNYRRIQRFFKDYTINYDSLVEFVLKILPQNIRYILTLDRTNWKFGKTDINILMLAIVYKDTSIPLCWELLPKRGNSNYTERKQIVNRAIKLLGKQKIKSLVADREFGCGKFFRYLKKEGICFHIRIKKTSVATKYMKSQKSVSEIFDSIKSFRYVMIPQKKIIYKEEVYIGGNKTRSGDYLILASSENSHEALKEYCQRWTIEKMFGYFKSKGFDFEQTHLTDSEKIKKLIALMTIAFVWSYLVGIWMTESLKIKIKIKKNGRKEISIFRKGLDYIRKLLFNEGKFTFEYNSIIKILSCA